MAWLAVLVVSLAVAVAPSSVAWPHIYGRLVPQPLRGGVAADPVLRAGLAVLPYSVLAGLAWIVMVQSLGPATAQGLVLAGLVGLAPTQIALHRAAVVAAVVHDWTPDGRRRSPKPISDRLDRGLRRTLHWTAALGVLWYIVGRGGQLFGEGRAAAWWWGGALLLCCVAAGAWLLRGYFRASAVDLGRPDGPLAALGLTISRPGGPGLADAVPGVFATPAAAVGPIRWPWRAAGSIRGHRVVVGQQICQLRTRYVTKTARRTVCQVSMSGRVPHVQVTGRDGVPPRELSRSIDLELDGFNRRMWAWGPDARGFFDLMSPRAMEALLELLPGGARVRTGGGRVLVSSDEPLSDQQVAALVQVGVRIAELLPSYLRA